MLKPASPCLKCNKRSEDCHKNCEKYLQYVEDNEKYKDLINQSKQEESIGFTLIEKQLDRKYKKHKFKKGCYW